MKKERLLWAVVSSFLAVLVLALALDDLGTRRELKTARAELADGELYTTLAMSELWGLSYDPESKVPERELPHQAHERLLALADRVEKRVDGCMLAKAKIEAKLGGYYDPHAHRGED